MTLFVDGRSDSELSRCRSSVAILAVFTVAVNQRAGSIYYEDILYFWG